MPEPPEAPVSRRTGDLWRLGSHRLLCGDATRAEDVARVIGGEAPHLMGHDLLLQVYGWRDHPNWFLLLARRC